MTCGAKEDLLSSLLQTLDMGEFASLLFLSFSDAEDCGISK